MQIWEYENTDYISNFRTTDSILRWLLAQAFYTDLSTATSQTAEGVRLQTKGHGQMRGIRVCLWTKLFSNEALLTLWHRPALY